MDQEAGRLGTPVTGGMDNQVHIQTTGLVILGLAAGAVEAAPRVSSRMGAGAAAGSVFSGKEVQGLVGF